MARFGPGTAMLTAMRSVGEALAPALARELAPVRVNAVTPGLKDTPLLHTADGAERDAIVQNRAAVLPGKRVGTAEVTQVILMCRGVAPGRTPGIRHGADWNPLIKECLSRGVGDPWLHAAEEEREFA